MKFIVSVLILFFMIGLPLSQIKSNYYIFQTYKNGVINESEIIRKTENGYSSRINHYLYVFKENQEISIRVSSSICNRKSIGEIVKYKYIEGNDFGVYEGGFYAVANFFANFLTIILGFIFLYYTFKQK